jgi:hypothetical protein
MKYLFVILAMVTGLVHAHEFTPTYPRFQPAFVSGVHETTMYLRNLRKDVGFYEIDVFDSAWNPIVFSTIDKILPLRYMESKNVVVYVRASDVARVTYICSRSKLFKNEPSNTPIASRICSKVKQ